jgi:hypothetical protein
MLIKEQRRNIHVELFIFPLSVVVQEEIKERERKKIRIL